METSPALEADIRERVQKLEKLCDHIISCHVVVEQLHRHKHRGNLFNIRIDVAVPGKTLIVEHEHRMDHGHEDAYVAARDSFNAMGRKLEDYARRERGDVKHHDEPDHGRIVELYPNMDYGNIESSDGRVIYFHRNSIVNGNFDDLENGTRVRYVEEAGDEGPQASSVSIIDKHYVTG